MPSIIYEFSLWNALFSVLFVGGVVLFVLWVVRKFVGERINMLSTTVLEALNIDRHRIDRLEASVQEVLNRQDELSARVGLIEEQMQAEEV